METSKFKWSDYAGRRRINLVAFAEKNNLSSYEDLARKCEQLGVEPPSKEEVSHVLLDEETLLKQKRAEAARLAREAKKKVSSKKKSKQKTEEKQEDPEPKKEAPEDDLYT